MEVFIKSRKRFSRILSIILVISIFTILTSCSSKLEDNFVEYVDPNNGVSYTYNSTYLLSVDDEEASTQMKDFDVELYDDAKADKDVYSAAYADTQYYIIRNSSNKIDFSCPTFYYLDAGQIFGDIKQSDISDVQYQSLVSNFKQQMVLNGTIADEDDVRNKTLTFGENEYLHIKLNLRSGGDKSVFETFLLQLDNGDVITFVINCYEAEYDNAYANATKVLETVKVN